MSVETDPSGLGRYRELANNPIYYYGALQYCGGEFYRRALGYEVLWDTKKEAELMLCLDYVLSDYRDKGQYYFEELKVERDFRLHGVNWPRGIAPKNLSFALQWAFELKTGESLTARVNLLDKPNHVDLERSNGDVFSIPYVRYQHLKDNGSFKVKGERHETKSKTGRNAIKSGKAKSLSLVRQLIKENTTRPLLKRVLNLR